MPVTVSARARLRARNQLTLPDPVVEQAGLEEGTTFVVEVSQEDPDTVLLHRVRESYAGALRGAYGNTAKYLKEERGSWG